MLNIKTFVCNPFQENTYVVSDETNEAVIIDCGILFTNEHNELINYITENKLKPVLLLSTHGHIDHNFGIDTIVEKYKIRPMVHHGDSSLMNRLAEQSLAFCNYRLTNEMPSVSRYLSDSDILHFGSHEIKVIHTPGHSPGSVIFYIESEQTAFTGDTIFKMSIGRTDLEGGSYNDIVNSLRKIITELQDTTVLLPGHGPQTTIVKEKMYNPYIR